MISSGFFTDLGGGTAPTASGVAPLKQTLVITKYLSPVWLASRTTSQVQPRRHCRWGEKRSVTYGVSIRKCPWDSSIKPQRNHSRSFAPRFERKKR